MRCPLPIIWILLSFPLLLAAQGSQRIDSLLNQLENATTEIKKAELYGGLWSAYIDNGVDQALQYAESIVQVGIKMKADTIISYGYQKKGITYAYKNEFDSSGIYFRKALVLYEKVNDYESIASIQRNLGQDHNMVGELDSASYYFQQAGENFARIDDSVGMADIYNSEAIVYYVKGYHNLAFEKAVAGEKIFMQHQDLGAELSQNRLVIAAIYSAMKDTINAVSYFKKSIDYFKASGLQRQYASGGVLLADLLIPKYQTYPEISGLVEDIVLVSQTLQDPTLINQARLQQAELAYQKGHYEEARRIQSELVNSTLGEGQEYLQGINTLALGKTQLAMQNYARAIENLTLSESIIGQIGIQEPHRDVNKLLAETYEAIGDYENSLTYFKAYKALEEKIYDQERTNRFDELQTIYEIEKKENALALQEEEIKTLNAQAKANQLTTTLYGTGMVSFIIISGLLFFGFRQRMKKNRIEREKQEAILKQELAFKRKELTSQTLHLVQKNTFIQELQENLEKIKQSPELFKVEFRKLIMLLRRQSSEDQNWEVFKSYFSEVHNDFDRNLKSISNELTENDVRLASFIRMNLTTKEIASLINVLPESVQKSKYRLKKKLGLPKEQGLTEYLNRL